MCTSVCCCVSLVVYQCISWDGVDSESPPCGLQVFFTRNGKLMGRREVGVPPGGLYPTVGMLSSGEKVKVDLHPLSG